MLQKFHLRPTFSLLLLGVVLLVSYACSTQRDNMLSRNSHALSTKYNILYNGGLELDKGVAEIRANYQDNFWDILPIERLNVVDPKLLEGKAKNQHFEKAETKATKAIQKHSMYIDGAEKNYQIDEAHLMLGMARYYEQRFIPALEAFNYVLYKYPLSSCINEVKIWREKTNMRLNNDELAITNLRALLRQLKLKPQVAADAHATLAQAYLNINQPDSAIGHLRQASRLAPVKDDKARYTFIAAQVYEKLQQSDSAYAYYQKVIDMRRKSPRIYVIQAHARQGKSFNPATNDTVAFLKKYNELLADRENRPMLDVLYHQMALFYDKQKKYTQAIGFYNKSLRKRSNDQYMMASNYRNIAQAYFNTAKYLKAGTYFDSTLALLDNRSREFKAIKKKRDNLNDVIKYEGIAQRNDSILRVCAMPPFDREAYYQKHIDKLKQDEQKALLANLKAAKEATKNGQAAGDAGASAIQQQLDRMAARSGGGTSAGFYFYTPSTVDFGREQFKKLWGDRARKGYWRTAGKDNASKNDAPETTDNKVPAAVANANDELPQYKPSFYTQQLPKSKVVLDSLAIERNFAYYQLGMIYKEKFKEYALSADKFEKLLANKPEERLVLPSLYHLYKVYQIIDTAQAERIRQRILKDYPDSRYAELLRMTGNSTQLANAPRETYDKRYKAYQSGALRETYADVKEDIDLFTGEEIVPKFELLKARLAGRLIGLKEYANQLNYVALNYPNQAEGREAEQLLGTQVNKLDALAFSNADAKNWKIIFKADPLDSPEKQALLAKITTFAKERTIDKLYVTTDLYTLTDNLFVIHGIKSKNNAESIVNVLKDYKDYMIQEPMYIVSSDNYGVIQIKKCLDAYIEGKPAPVYGFHFKAPAAEPAPQQAPDKGQNKDQNNMPPQGQSDPTNPAANMPPNGQANPPVPNGQNPQQGMFGDDPVPNSPKGAESRNENNLPIKKP